MADISHSHFKTDHLHSQHSIGMCQLFLPQRMARLKGNNLVWKATCKKSTFSFKIFYIKTSYAWKIREKMPYLSNWKEQHLCSHGKVCKLLLPPPLIIRLPFEILLSLTVRLFSKFHMHQYFFFYKHGRSRFTILVNENLFSLPYDINNCKSNYEKVTHFWQIYCYKYLS